MENNSESALIDYQVGQSIKFNQSGKETTGKIGSVLGTAVLVEFTDEQPLTDGKKPLRLVQKKDITGIIEEAKPDPVTEVKKLEVPKSMEEQVADILRPYTSGIKITKLFPLVAHISGVGANAKDFSNVLLEHADAFQVWKDKGKSWQVRLLPTKQVVVSTTEGGKTVVKPVETTEPEVVDFDALMRHFDETDCQNKIRKLSYAVKGMILGQDELIDLEVATLLAQGGLILQGQPGVAKSRSIDLISRLSGLKRFKYEFNRDTMVQELTGGVKIKKTTFDNGEEEIDFKYLMRGVLEADVFVGNEIQEAGSGAIQALRQVTEEREWQGMLIPLKAYFYTMNPSAFKNFKVADIDRAFAVYNVISNITRENTDAVDAIIKLEDTGKAEEIPKPILNRPQMLTAIEWCKKVSVSSVYDEISLIAGAFAKICQREITERWLGQAVLLVKANAFMRGRMVAHLSNPSDLDILEHTAEKYGIKPVTAKNIIKAIAEGDKELIETLDAPVVDFLKANMELEEKPATTETTETTKSEETTEEKTDAD